MCTAGHPSSSVIASCFLCGFGWLVCGLNGTADATSQGGTAFFVMIENGNAARERESKRERDSNTHVERKKYNALCTDFGCKLHNREKSNQRRLWASTARFTQIPPFSTPCEHCIHTRKTVSLSLNQHGLGARRAQVCMRVRACLSTTAQSPTHSRSCVCRALSSCAWWQPHTLSTQWHGG